MQQPDTLSAEMLSRIRAQAFEQVALIDQMEAALKRDDVPRVIALARRICEIEREE